MVNGEETLKGSDVAEMALACKASLIPNRQVRRMGSEFLGKRSGRWIDWIEQLCLNEEPSVCQCIQDSISSVVVAPMKRGLGAILLSGKRMTNGRHLPNGFMRRAMGSEFLGKRALGSEFLGKRRPLGSEFLGKRSDPQLVRQTPESSESEYV